MTTTTTTTTTSTGSSSLFAAVLPPHDGATSSLFVDAAHHYWSSSFPSSPHAPPPTSPAPAGVVLPPRALAGTASATLTYLSLLLAHDRPRGRMCLPDPGNALAVRPSLVPGGGLGLYAAGRRPLPRGTVLGTYPGVLRPAGAFYGGKCRRFPNALSYSWRFTDDAYVIDPTDDGGELRDTCVGGGSGAPLSTLLFSTLLGGGGRARRFAGSTSHQ